MTTLEEAQYRVGLPIETFWDTRKQLWIARTAVIGGGAQGSGSTHANALADLVEKWESKADS